MIQPYLESCVYPSNTFSGKFKTLPAIKLYEKIDDFFDIDNNTYFVVKTKLEQSIRKMCMMWHAAEEAINVESEFYSSTIQDAPALFGEDAIRVNYHLEAMIWVHLSFANSSF